ncbi:piwi-like protein 1 isoform X1 [Ictalurus punctatus]|uniref:Piwi-like protein 1 isoform X1 n=1 Tax=Ictalurus punctatus TaxID=7998 RepID=A0A9F7TM62_ICTPU|nr:piwi-like protein 1 isoform X1 [Ictalurus punctatus]XP_053540408.1 piwi-like protein 1 isoform X1 [Ictalurus punctatus]
MKDLSTHTRLTPEQWENRLNRFINNMSRNASVQTTLSTWDLSFENKLLNLTGRVLPAERILQGARAVRGTTENTTAHDTCRTLAECSVCAQYEYNPCDADWSKEMRGLPLMTSMPLETWLLSHTRRNAEVAHSLLQTLNKVPVGIHLQRPGMMEYDDRQEALLRALQQRVGQQVQMVVVILSANRKDKYDCVKKYLCVDCPTPSQCVVARTLSRPQTLMTIATKISLQMNCKMEGEPWSVEIPLKHLMMLVSTDTTTVPQERDPSVHWWPASTRACPAALKAYFKYNECLPSRIVVWATACC